VLNYPEGIIVGRDGQLYFSDAGNQRIRAYSFSTKATRTISGSGERGLATGRGTIARWNSPKGLAQRGLDGSALYICDFYNDMIKRVSLR
jgi:hypothetical protein